VRPRIDPARLTRDESGAAAVEFAIVSVAFITFIFGIAFTALMLHSNATLQWVVETTIREAALNPNITQAQMRTAVNDLLISMKMPPASSVDYNVTEGAIPVANLTASFNRTFTIPFVATFNNTYTATARMSQSGV
jgi:Flp pilus assembly protein TadG